MANETDQELLALARTALARRLNGDAYHGYSEADRRFEGATITELRNLIKDLEKSVALSSSSRRYCPVRSVDV